MKGVCQVGLMSAHEYITGVRGELGFVLEHVLMGLELVPIVLLY